MPTLAELRQEPHHSYSSLSTFLTICPMQYAFRYIYKLEPERTGISLPFGSAFHGALSWLANRRKVGDHNQGRGARRSVLGTMEGREQADCRPQIQVPRRVGRFERSRTEDGHRFPRELER